MGSIADVVPQVAADDDRSAVLAWLARYADTPATLASYRKEAERLPAVVRPSARGVAMSSLTHEDLLLYERFLGDPQPAERWVMTVRQRPGRDSPHWRPFAGAVVHLQPASCTVHHQCLVFLGWWRQATSQATRFAWPTQTAPCRPEANSRFLPHEHWEEVKATILAMPTNTPREAAHAARCRWLFSLLYIGGLRVSEVNSSTMGGFTASVIEPASSAGG